jgi:succinylarginine dihydrolase
MAAAEESGDTSAAAVTARAAALRALGFEGALKGLLEAQRQAAAEAAAAAAAGGMVHTAASTTAAAAAEGAGAAPEVELQDLFERLQTALAQLGVGGS